MKLYLVQHGISKPSEEDPERPLTGEGLMETSRIGAFTAALEAVSAGRIVHSGKLRAEQTAETLARCFKIKEPTEESDGLAPMDDPSLWADRLGKIGENTILVGHLPHLQRLTSLLICGNAEAKAVTFKNSGMACLERDGEGNWSFEWAVTPEFIRNV